MLSPHHLLRMLTELVFVLVGGFLAWLALSGRFLFDTRRPAWLALAAVLVVWGVLTWARTRRYARTSARLAMRIGGASVVLVGTIMFWMAWVSFLWAGKVMAAAGGILVLRGLVSAALALRSD